jgi:hypothetical protein
MDGGEKGLADMNHRSSMFFGKTTQDALWKNEEEVPTNRWSTKREDVGPKLENAKCQAMKIYLLCNEKS